MRRASIHGNAFIKKILAQPPGPPFCQKDLDLFRIEEAKAQCALLNSESLCA